jgi:hypothetical protein
VAASRRQDQWRHLGLVLRIHVSAFGQQARNALLVARHRGLVQRRLLGDDHHRQPDDSQGDK